MTARSIRRAQERKAKKLERKAATRQASEPTTAAVAAPEEIAFDEFEGLSFEPITEPAPLSPARLAANQANAQLSTGPRSQEGKAKSSLNAVKSALTGRTVLLPSDDVPEYESFCASFEQELHPVGQQENELVQSIADSYWRIRRIGSLEMAIFAQGYIQFADQFDHADPPPAAASSNSTPSCTTKNNSATYNYRKRAYNAAAKKTRSNSAASKRARRA